MLPLILSTLTLSAEIFFVFEWTHSFLFGLVVLFFERRYPLRASSAFVFVSHPLNLFALRHKTRLNWKMWKTGTKVHVPKGPRYQRIKRPRSFAEFEKLGTPREKNKNFFEKLPPTFFLIRNRVHLWPVPPETNTFLYKYTCFLLWFFSLSMLQWVRVTIEE